MEGLKANIDELVSCFSQRSLGKWCNLGAIDGGKFCKNKSLHVLQESGNNAKGYKHVSV